MESEAEELARLRENKRLAEALKMAEWMNHAKDVMIDEAEKDVHYVLGLFTADEDKDLLNISNWTKGRVPVLSFYSVKGEFGPGHNSFFINEDGEMMIAFHGETDIKSNLRCDGIRRVHFRQDGTPYFQMSAEEDLKEAVVETVLHVKN